MGDTVKRKLSVGFTSTGQAKLIQQVNQVDKSLEKTGADGTKSLQSMDRAMTGVGESMANALDPIDKAFAGTDKLFSIIGKAGAVGAVAVAAWEGISLAVDALAASSRAGVEEQDALAASLVRTSAAAEHTTAAIDALFATGSLSQRAIEERIAKLKTEADERDNLAAAVDGHRRASSDLAVVEETLAAAQVRAQAAADSLAGATARGSVEQRVALQALSDATAEADRLADTQDALRLKVAFTGRQIEILSGSLNELSGVSHTTVSDLVAFGGLFADHWAKLSATHTKATGQIKREAEDMLTVFERTSVTPLADQLGLGDGKLELVSEEFERWAGVVGTLQWRLGQLGETLDGIDLSAVAVEVDSISDSLLMSAEAFGQATVAALFMGQSIKDVLNQQLQGLAIEATWEALKATAIGIARASYGDPGAGAMFQAAGIWAAIAAGAAAGTAATGGFGGGGGGGAAAAAGGGGSQGLSGQGSAGSSQVSVVLNLSGPVGGIGRVLVDEINRESQRQGGARVASTAVRR
jgi:hypothetical protein